MPRRSVRKADPSIPGEPRYRLHASGQAVVELSRRTVYLGRFGSAESQERYRSAVGEWIARGRRPAEAAALPLSVNELLVSYRDAMQAYYRRPDGTVNEKEVWHVRRALLPLSELFGLGAAADFGPKKLAIVRDRFIASGLCRNVVNRYTRRLRHAFKWGAAQELVPATIWQSLAALDGLRKGRTSARETEPVKPVPDGLVDAIREHVSREVWGLIEVQRYSGCRPGEAVLLRAVDIDVSGKVWLYRPAHHKTEHVDKARVIALGPKAQAAIRPFLTSDVNAYLFRPVDAERERRAALSAKRVTPLSCGNTVGSNRRRRPEKQPGPRYTTESYLRAVRDGCDKAFPLPVDLAQRDGEPRDGWRARLTPEQRAQVKAWWREHRWHPNQLRHGFATAVRREFSLDAAQVALGHSSADVTQVYAERDQQLAAEVALKIG
jgi:integrase